MSAKHVITSRTDTGTFERPKVADLFDDDNQALIAPRVLADTAG